MKKPDSDNLPGGKQLEGFAIDLIELLAQKLENFDYEIVLCPGGKFGSADINGNWDGMVGELLNGVGSVSVLACNNVFFLSILLFLIIFYDNRRFN